MTEDKVYLGIVSIKTNKNVITEYIVIHDDKIDKVVLDSAVILSNGNIKLIEKNINKLFPVIKKIEVTGYVARLETSLGLSFFIKSIDEDNSPQLMMLDNEKNHFPLFLNLEWNVIKSLVLLVLKIRYPAYCKRSMVMK